MFRVACMYQIFIFSATEPLAVCFKREEMTMGDAIKCKEVFVKVSRMDNAKEFFLKIEKNFKN